MAEIGGRLVGGLVRGLMSSNPVQMVEKIFGSLPAALGAIVGKGLVSIADLPGKALAALGSLGGDVLGLLGGGGISFGNTVQLGRVMAAAHGWTGAQFNALNELWTRESGWNPLAKNASSGAYGIPQSLPASKMASAGAD